MPIASDSCGIAPMKNADWAVFVVPVLAMIARPSLIPAAAPVPSYATFDIAYWTCDAISEFTIGLWLNTG